MPDTGKCPDDLLKDISAQQVYLVKNLPLSRLINIEFIEAFVKRGDMYMISEGTQIDTETCVALIPTGELILNVERDTYEKMGLEGKPSLFNGKRRRKYVVTIDLTAPHFKPEKKNYQRVLRSFTEFLDLHFDFLITWVPNDESISPSSIGAYFGNNSYECTQCKQTQRTKKMMASCPVIRSECTQGGADACDYQQFYEWLGAVACGIDCMEGGPDNYLSSFCCPTPRTPTLSCVTCKVHSGLITADSVASILTKLRDHVKMCHCPWFSLTVHGFADSPVTWGKHEHGFFMSGDNTYTYVGFCSDDYWLYRAMATHDICS